MVQITFGGQTVQLNVGENTRAAQRAAILAGHYANDSTDTDVPGGSVGDRGAKYWADKAQTDGAAQVASATAISAGIAAQTINIGPTKTITSATIGSTTPDTNNATMTNMFANARGPTAPSTTASVDVRIGTSTATLVLFVVDPVTRRVLAKSADLSAVVGVNNFATPFGSFVAPAGSVLFVYRKSGTGVLRSATGTFSVFSLTAINANVGDALGAFTVSATLAMGVAWNTQAVTGSLEPRLTVNEIADAQVSGESGQMRTLTLGPSSFTVAGASATNICLGKPVYADCVLTGERIDFSGAATGFLELWNPRDGALYLADRIYIECSASGTATYAVPNWQAFHGSFVVYRRLTGANPTYSAGYAYWTFPTGTPAIGDTATPSSAINAIINMAHVIRVPRRRSNRGNQRTNFGPTEVEYQQFTGTSAPAAWSGTTTAPFSVSNGLVCSGGGGGWDKNALFVDQGTTSLEGGWSASRKRFFMFQVTMTDTASVGGICTFPVLTSTGGGTQLLFDGANNRLALHYWTGGATAGTLVASAAYGSSLVAGRSYIITATLDGLTMTCTMTDPLGGSTVATFTYNTPTSSGSNALTSPRFQGRPGVNYQAGTFTIDWIRFGNNVPRNLRLLVVGDSNAEGIYVLSATPWVNSLASTYGRILNCSAAGERSSHMLARASDIANMRPDMVLILGSPNDAANLTTAESLANVQALVDVCDNIGAEVILGTPTPFVAQQAKTTAIADAMTGGTFGRRRIFDQLGLLSNANDRLTWNASYNSGDGVHYNATGNAAVLAYATRVIPELLL